MLIMMPLMALNTPDEQDFMMELLHEYEALMFSTARRYAKAANRAEDIVQESLVRLIDHIQTIMAIPRCNLAGYVVNTVKNTALNQLRAEQVRRKYVVEDVSPDEAGDRAAGTSPELLVLRQEDSRSFYQVWTTLSEAVRHFSEEEPRGEYVLVIEGRSFEEKKEEREQSFKDLSIEEHLAIYEAQGLERKEAMKRAAKDRGVSKREIYDAVMKD